MWAHLCPVRENRVFQKHIVTARIIVLTGERSAGKSTVCREIIALAQARGYTCGGVLTSSRSNGTRDVLDLHSGDVRQLTLESDAPQAVVQGRFRFDPETLAWANASFAQATPCHLLVVDELGPLEMERGEGWPKALDVLRGTDFAMAIVVRPELIVSARLKLPVNATTVLTVTPHNRDDLPAALLEVLERAVGSTSRRGYVPLPLPSQGKGPGG